MGKSIVGAVHAASAENCKNWQKYSWIVRVLSHDLHRLSKFWNVHTEHSHWLTDILTTLTTLTNSQQLAATMNPLPDFRERGICFHFMFRILLLRKDFQNAKLANRSNSRVPFLVFDKDSATAGSDLVDAVSLVNKSESNMHKSGTISRPTLLDRTVIFHLKGKRDEIDGSSPPRQSPQQLNKMKFLQFSAHQFKIAGRPSSPSHSKHQQPGSNTSQAILLYNQKYKFSQHKIHLQYINAAGHLSVSFVIQSNVLNQRLTFLSPH